MRGAYGWIKGVLVGGLLTGCVADGDPPVPAGGGPEGGQPAALTTASSDSGASKQTPSGDLSRPIAPHAVIDSGVAVPRRYMVQVGAYNRRSAATALAADLGLMGLTAQVVSEAGVHRVRIGPIATVSEARNLGDRLKRDLGLDYWVDSR